MAVTIRTRRDEALDWTTANPVLALGELGIETDTDKMKYGDGISAWNDLPYFVEPSLPEAPVDGVPYTRKNAAWVSSVETTGSNKIDAIEVVSALPGTPDANTLYMVV